MIYRLLTFVVGLSLTTVGTTFVILAGSYIFTGCGFAAYLQAIFCDPEFYLLLIGVTLMIVSLFCDGLWRKLRAFLKGRRRS